MDRSPASGGPGAREQARVADPGRREHQPPAPPRSVPADAAPGGRRSEREGPLEIERLRKDDGRALISYRLEHERD